MKDNIVTIRNTKTDGQRGYPSPLRARLPRRRNTSGAILAPIIAPTTAPRACPPEPAAAKAGRMVTRESGVNLAKLQGTGITGTSPITNKTAAPRVILRPIFLVIPRRPIMSLKTLMIRIAKWPWPLLLHRPKHTRSPGYQELLSALDYRNGPASQYYTTELRPRCSE
jgi:hypothetical protein